MKALRPMLVVAIALSAMSCGSSTDTTTQPSSTASARTMTATYNGIDFKPNLLTSAYLGSQVAVNAADGTRNLIISGVGVSKTGTYSVAPGNANSLLGQWIDGNTGSFTSVFPGNAGTVTFTVLELGRVAGSFDFVMRNQATGSTATIALKGTFDIKFP